MKRRIARIVKVGDQGVPVDANGYYLDWKEIRGDYANVLTSPHGPRYFILGNEEARIVLDFARLPDGKFFLTAACEPDELDLHPEDRTIVCEPGEVAEAACHLVMHSIQALDRLGITCKDPWDFVLKVCFHAESTKAVGKDA